MLIGDRYKENNLYRGIKHYDGFPLTSKDMHEYADTLQMKNAFLLDNIIGSGPLNEPKCSISSRGISIESPAVILLEGDIVLIQSDEETPLVPMYKIRQATKSNGSTITDGLVCAIGWYQHLTVKSDLKPYGGIENITFEKDEDGNNDLLDKDLNIQVSTRYQFRWETTVVDYDTYRSGEFFRFNRVRENEVGRYSLHELRVLESTEVVRILHEGDKSEYSDAVDKIYLIPLIKYSYDGNAIIKASPYRAIRPTGTTSFITTNTEPTGDDYSEGTIWFNPDNYKFKFYVPDVGFIPTASDIAFLQTSNTITINLERTTPEDISLDIGIHNYDSSDILQVTYNGTVLTLDQHYSVNTDTKKIKLLGFTTRVGDSVTFTATKLVDTTSSNTIVTEFFSHVSNRGNSTTSGHVLLSDTADKDIGAAEGVAVTPKALYDATTLIDSVTNKKYRLVITGGILDIQEIF